MISVCIATYNGERYIREQIDSILPQLSEEDEIVVSDDGSTDDTVEIIKQYNDPRIKILHNKRDERLKNKNVAPLRFIAFNFENALLNAQGDYIFLADQDDIWEPDKVSECCRLLEQYCLVLSNHSIIDKDGKIIKEQFYDKNPINSVFIKNFAAFPFLGCCMAFRRSVLKYALPMPKNCVCHDNWIGCSIIFNDSYTFIQKPLHRYRTHEGNCSPTNHKEKNRNSLFFKLKYRLEMLAGIIYRHYKQ